MNSPKQQSKINQVFLERLTTLIISEMASGHVSLETIASEMFITRGQLNRKVKSITGITTQQFAMDIRLKNACKLIDNNPNIVISEVAYRCGFDDATSFSRAFRRFHDMSPSQYRNKKNEI